MDFFVHEQPSLKPQGFRHSLYGVLAMPRPIGWISTISAAGVVNLAPYSFFNLVSVQPLACMYCISGNRPDGGAKHSLENVRQVPEFVVNLCTYELREQMNLTSASMPAGVDEMAQAGLDPAASLSVRPPRVEASPITLECRVVDILDLPSTGSQSNTMVLGQVELVHIADEVIEDGMVDYSRVRALGRLGYQDYVVVDESFSMIQPV